MQEINDKEVEGIIDHDKQLLCDFECNRCTFAHAGIIARGESQKNPSGRATVRNIRLESCFAAINMLRDSEIGPIGKAHLLILAPSIYNGVEVLGIDLSVGEISP